MEYLQAQDGGDVPGRDAQTLRASGARVPAHGLTRRAFRPAVVQRPSPWLAGRW